MKVLAHWVLRRTNEKNGSMFSWNTYGVAKRFNRFGYSCFVSIKNWGYPQAILRRSRRDRPTLIPKLNIDKALWGLCSSAKILQRIDDLMGYLLRKRRMIVNHAPDVTKGLG